MKWVAMDFFPELHDWVTRSLEIALEAAHYDANYEQNRDCRNPQAEDDPWAPPWPWP